VADTFDEAKAAFRAGRWDAGGLGINPSQKIEPARMSFGRVPFRSAHEVGGTGGAPIERDAFYRADASEMN
jgi:hypothetical protein